MTWVSPTPDRSRIPYRPYARVENCTGLLTIAWQHNRSETDDVPVMIEFQASEHLVAIDGRDFLYSIFQLGDPARAQPLLERAYGTAVLRYAKKAWGSEIQEFRIAMCDLAVHDLDVIKAHHANDIILAGRHRTMFRNAFVVRLPIIPSALIGVWSPENPIRSVVSAS